MALFLSIKLRNNILYIAPNAFISTIFRVLCLLFSLYRLNCVSLTMLWLANHRRSPVKCKGPKMNFQRTIFNLLAHHNSMFTPPSLPPIFIYFNSHFVEVFNIEVCTCVRVYVCTYVRVYVCTTGH